MAGWTGGGGKDWVTFSKIGSPLTWIGFFKTKTPDAPKETEPSWRTWENNRNKRRWITPSVLYTAIPKLLVLNQSESHIKVHQRCKMADGLFAKEADLSIVLCLSSQLTKVGAAVQRGHRKHCLPAYWIRIVIHSSVHIGLDGREGDDSSDLAPKCCWWFGKCHMGPVLVQQLQWTPQNRISSGGVPWVITSNRGIYHDPSFGIQIISCWAVGMNIKV